MVRGHEVLKYSCIAELDSRVPVPVAGVERVGV